MPIATTRRTKGRPMIPRSPPASTFRPFEVGDIVRTNYDTGPYRILKIFHKKRNGEAHLRVLMGAIGKRLTYRRLAAVGDCGFMGLK